MYQVIYSSVVIWCAILTFFFMGRKLSGMQWVAIFGVSAGLAISSMDNFTNQSKAATLEESGTLYTKLIIYSV